MKLFSASMRWILVLVLALHGAAATAANPDPEMRAALAQLLAALHLDAAVAGIPDVRAGFTDSLMAGMDSGITDNKTWSEAKRARARVLIHELRPRIAAAVDAELAKIDVRAIMVSAYETVYSTYFSAAEIRQLAAMFTDRGCQTAQAQGPASGQAVAATRDDEPGDPCLRAFLRSPLGQKHKVVAAEVEKAVRAQTRYQFSQAMRKVQAALLVLMESVWKQLETEPGTS